MVKKKIKYIYDEVQSTLELNIHSCLIQINEYLKFNKLTIENVAMISAFIRTNPDELKYHYLILKEKLFAALPYIPYTVIPQAPFQNNIALELIIIEGDYTTSILKKYDADAIAINDSIQKNADKQDYENKPIIKLYEFADHCELYYSGSHNHDDVACSLQSNTAFKEMENRFLENDFKLNDIIRQWNYIGNILKIQKDKGKLLQNYQAFNDSRSEFYNKYNWDNGYPAATGIGTDSLNVNITSIAYKLATFYSIRNPLQRDAHLYSGNVLVGSSNEIKTTPKFERAKIVFYNNYLDLFVSGTAAIRDEDIYEDKRIEDQTKISIENILKLIDRDNIINQTHEKYHDNIPVNLKDRLTNIRAYVKFECDINKVKNIIDDYFGEIEAIYTVAEICRDDLLVEIEASALSI